MKILDLDLNILTDNFITGLNGPHGLVVYNGDLYVSNERGNSVFKYLLLPGGIATKDETFSLNVEAPVGIAVTSIYGIPYLFVSQYGGNPQGVNKYDLNGNFISNFSETNSPAGILFYGNRFFVASYGTNALYIYAYENNVPCFEKNTKILCLKDNEEVYVTISELKKGDLIKTYKHGFKKLDLIGSGVFLNDVSNPFRSMYKHKHNVDGFDNLVITGGHSILVDHLLEEENLQQQKINFDYKIEDKQMSLSAFSKDFEKIKTGNVFTYYHIVLENDDENGKYGIWANGGILTETCERSHFLKNFTM